MKEKVFMGIDASSTCTGVSVFKENKLIFYTMIKPSGSDWRERLFNEGPELSKIIEEYKPNKIYMEDVPLQSTGGLKTLVILGGVQGFVYGVAASKGVPIEFISPSSWRSKAGLFDGTKEGKKRDVLKQKSVEMANKQFGLELNWSGPNSKKSEHDIAEAILICATMTGVISKDKKFGRNVF